MKCDLCNYCLMEAKKEKAVSVTCKKCGAKYSFKNAKYVQTKKGKRIKHKELFDSNGIFEYATPT